MPTITIEIESNSNARKFLYFARNMKFVKSAKIKHDVIEPLTDEDWIKPGRLAIDEEIEARIAKCEDDIASGNCIPFEQLDSFVKEHLRLKGYNL